MSHALYHPIQSDLVQISRTLEPVNGRVVSAPHISVNTWKPRLFSNRVTPPKSTLPPDARGERFTMLVDGERMKIQTNYRGKLHVMKFVELPVETPEHGCWDAQCTNRIKDPEASYSQFTERMDVGFQVLSDRGQAVVGGCTVI